MSDLPINDLSLRPGRPSRLHRMTNAVFSPLNRVAELVFTRPVWGVARTSLSVMLRSSPAATAMVLLAVFLIWLPSMKSGAGTLGGRAQLYMNFQDLLSNRVQQYLSLGLTAVYYLGSVLVILLAAGVIVGEIQTRTILLTLSKPLSRWQYVLGKGLALAMLTFLIVFGSGGIMGLRLWWLTQQPANARDHERLMTEVLVARESILLTMPDKELEEKISQRKQQIQTERSEPTHAWTEEEENQIRSDILTRYFSIPPGQYQGYTFSNLAPARSLKLFQIRYQVDATGQVAQDLLSVIFVVGDRKKAAQVQVDRRDLVRVAHTFTVPAETIAPDGTLLVTVVNPNARTPQSNWETTINLPQKNGLTVLYQAGGFADNFFRGLLLIWFYLLLLGALGLFFSALVTYPVAVLCSLTGLFTLLLMPWVAPSLKYLATTPERNDWWMNLTLPISQFLAQVVPDLSRLDPIDSLAGGMLVPWGLVGWGVLKLVVLASSMLLVLAILGLNRRELAAATQG